MSDRPSILTSAMFTCGPALLLAAVSIFTIAILLGVVQSIQSDRRLPPVNQNYHKDTYATVIEQKDYARGIPEMRLAAKLDFFEHRPRHLFELARAAYRVRDAADLEFARDSLQKMVVDGSVDARGRVYYYLSVVLTLQTPVDRATRMKSIELAEMSLSHDPKHAPSYSQLGLNWTQLGEYDKAMSCFSRALDLDGSLPQAQQGMRFLSGMRPTQ